MTAPPKSERFDVSLIATMSEAELIAKAALITQEREAIQTQVTADVFAGHPSSNWRMRACAAMRHKRLQVAAIKDELSRRKGAADRQARIEKQRLAAESAKAAAEAKKARSQQLAAEAAAARDVAQVKEQAKTSQLRQYLAQNEADIALFKVVAREVLGDEMYMHLWELTNQRKAMEGRHA